MKHAFETLFLVAFLLYATVIISHQVLNRFSRWMGHTFTLAWLADLTATYAVCVVFSDGWKWTAHSISGIAILVIMGLHRLWWHFAERGGQRARLLFHWLSPIAGSIWVIVTVSGSEASFQLQVFIDTIVIASFALIGVVWHFTREQWRGRPI